MMELHLVIGGMRSGKSRYAQQLAQGARVTVLATALAGDAEMDERIKRHRAERPAHWTTVDVPPTSSGLADAVRAHSRDDTVLLIDCLTVWLSQLLAPPPGHAAQDELRAVAELLQALEHAPGKAIVVSNEIGLGVVPADALSRRVVDALGRLHQQLAERAQRVTWMVAGLPVAVKGGER